MESQHKVSLSGGMTRRNKILIAVLACLMVIVCGFFMSRLLKHKIHDVETFEGGLSGKTFPNIKGTWLLEMSVITRATPGILDLHRHHYPPGVSTCKIKVVVDEQDGPRFGGNITFPDGDQRVFVGIIGFGSTFANVVFEHGYCWIQFTHRRKADTIFHHQCPGEVVAGRGVMSKVE